MAGSPKKRERREAERLAAVGQELELGDAARFTGTEADLARAKRGSARHLEALLKLWFSGTPMSKLAELFDYPSELQVRITIEQAIAKSEIFGVDKDQMRAQIDGALRAHHQVAFDKAHPTMPEGIDPESASMLRAEQGAWMKLDLQIIDRIVSLNGLAAPQQVYVTPTGQDFDQMVALAAEAKGLGITKIVNPFDEDAHEEDL